MKTRCAVLSTLFLLMSGSHLAAAQTRSTTDYRRDKGEALAALDEQHYERSAALLHGLLQQNPADGELWLALARAYQGADQSTEAIQALERAYEMGYGVRAREAYRIASLYAGMGERDAVMRWLDVSLADRLENRPRLQQDEAFDAYRDDARFQKLAGVLPTRAFTREEGWRYDLDFLVEEIERLHASPDRPAFTPRFRAATEDLRRRIPDLPDSQVFVEMQRIVASLGDGHSVLYPIPSERVPLGNLPIDLWEFGDRVFVVGEAGEPTGLVGAEVLNFGMKSAAEVLRSLVPFVTRDNPMSLRRSRAFYLTMPAFLRAVGAADGDEEASITVRDGSGTVREVSLPAAGFRPPSPPRAQTANPPLYLQRADQSYWYTELADVDAVYFQYNQVRDNPDVPISDFADSLQAALRNSEAKNIIVDVRLNSGGNGSLNRPLVNALVHFETDAPDHQIYVLTARNTFSAAQNFINVVEAMTDAVFVGEPTGSRPNMVGENTTVILPFTGIRASISSRYFQDSHAQDDRIWIAPDVPVELTPEDYFADRDPVLEGVYELIRWKRDSR